MTRSPGRSKDCPSVSVLPLLPPPPNAEAMSFVLVAASSEDVSFSAKVVAVAVLDVGSREEEEEEGIIEACSLLPLLVVDGGVIKVLEGEVGDNTKFGAMASSPPLVVLILLVMVAD